MPEVASPEAPMQKIIIERNNVRESGADGPTLLFAHGFGCDQNMWRFVIPELERDFRVIAFDYVGSGRSLATAYDRRRYASLDGYAQDIVEICEALDLGEVTLVGHSVSGMIGLIAALRAPRRFARLAMVCPSPCFLNHPPDYFGGFERADLQALLDLMDKNYIGWAQYLAPLVIGSSNPQILQGELAESFCSTEPRIARTFAEATFLSDHRELLPQSSHPVLILQSRVDALAALQVGEYMHAHMPTSRLRIVEAEGHCLHMTHPQAVVDALREFVTERA
jgi:sigma-B regulation protein RsbQ